MLKRTHCYYLLITSFLFSCSASRFVKPLNEGESAITAGIGGPLITFSNTPILIPLTDITYAKGFTNDFTGFGSLHTTSLLFGTLHLEAGGLKELRKNEGWVPGISIAPSFHYMVDGWTWSSRFFPQLDVNAYWTYGKRNNLIYVGSNNFFDLNGVHTDGQQQPNVWLPGFHIGHTFVRPKSNYQVEFKYLALTTSNKNIVVDYIVPQSMNNGAFGLYFTYMFKF